MGHVTLTASLLRVICPAFAGLDIAYLHTKFDHSKRVVFVHVACRRGLVLLRRGDEISKERDNFWVFFPVDNALYSIAFGNHTKTAKPIEMPFWLMTQVGPMYHVLDERPDPKGKGAIVFWGET